MKTSAIIALGGNLGERKSNILGALSAIDSHPRIKLKKVSDLVESFAVTKSGVDPTQPKYLNGVAEIETDLKPKRLLEVLNGIEDSFGRVRIERWASRTLDIDIITYGMELIESKTLIIPHPRAHERAFVLVPWAGMDPEARLPGSGLVRDLAQRVADEVWPYAEL